MLLQASLTAAMEERQPRRRRTWWCFAELLKEGGGSNSSPLILVFVFRDFGERLECSRRTDVALFFARSFLVGPNPNGAQQVSRRDGGFVATR